MDWLQWLITNEGHACYHIAIFVLASLVYTRTHQVPLSRHRLAHQTLWVHICHWRRLYIGDWKLSSGNWALRTLLVSCSNFALWYQALCLCHSIPRREMFSNSDFATNCRSHRGRLSYLPLPLPAPSCFSSVLLIPVIHALSVGIQVGLLLHKLFIHHNTTQQPYPSLAYRS